MKDKIKALRRENKLSQTEFAERLGVSRASISAWERGERLPDSITAHKIFKEFDLNKTYFTPEFTEIGIVKGVNLSLLNCKGVQKLYDFYEELIKNEEYLKKS